MRTGYTLVRQKMRRVTFVFPVVTFFCDTDNKSSFHSTQLTLITADSAGLSGCIDVFMPYGQAIYIFFPKTG